ncbi:MAG: tRNA 2-selenouridine(34) synthase MnmH [Bacteroidota bacterium]|nr:tRNA 2-selenouridine(34) synthase MnmH [Bacteroidota bacterium]
MSQALNIDEFLKQGSGSVIIDVRTPKEFEQGHIPGAINMPLFSNEERVVVGTLYKQEGKQPAIVKGLEFVGPKMADMVLKAQQYSQNNTVYVHCWRGGMRSGSVAWLLQTYGLNVFTLRGGYKQFRNHVLNSFDIANEIKILGGRTGSGKTKLLQLLELNNEAVVDLEKLAHHKGSAFGGFGQVQPSQEQFENKLFVALQKVKEAKHIWIEDESRLVGKMVIPLPLWEKMRLAIITYVEIPFEKRAEKLLEEYGPLPKEQLAHAINAITKRMGLEQAAKALVALEQNDLSEVCRLCLLYYDKGYDHGLQDRKNLKLKRCVFENESLEEISQHLIRTSNDGI